MFSRRSADMGAEKQLSLFLDEKFWTPYAASKEGLSFERRHDRDMQLVGVDVVWTDNQSISYIDEKAQLYYVNRTLPTFAFEINSFQRYGLVKGWLLDDSLLTTDYNLIYPNARHEDVNRLTKNDFTSVEIVSLKKQVLWDWLNLQGLTRDFLISQGQYIRREYGPGKIRVPTKCPFAYFVRSAATVYAERPLNLVISKSILVSLASYVAVVSQQGLCFTKR